MFDDDEKKVIPFFEIGDQDQSSGPNNDGSQNDCLEKEKLMVSILDSINDGVFTIDFNMKITSFNRSAERITGYSAEEAIGQHCMDVFCNPTGLKDDCIVECPMKKTIRYKSL